jgi:hypothetical protein
MEPFVTDLMKLFKPERGADESFEDYQQRRKLAHKVSKQTRKGILFASSAPTPESGRRLDKTPRGTTYRKEA